MIEITYKDNYQQERVLSFQTLDDCRLAFSGCLTVPDYLLIEELKINGQVTGYKGLIGDFYRDLDQLDFTQ